MNFHHSLRTKSLTSIKAKILSCGTFLPETIVKSEDLFDEFHSERNYGIQRDWLVSNMGIAERRFSAPEMSPSDLAIPAARKAIERIPGFDRSEIDMVIFCGIERDQPEPATAHRIQQALDLSAKHTFDIANACIGFVDGIEIASKFIECGAIRHALIVTGEVTSRVAQGVTEMLKNGVSKSQVINKLGALSVGDAGGAVILGATNYTSSGFQLFNTSVDSNHIDKCFYRHTESGLEAQMLMGKILAQGIKMHRAMIPETLNLLGWGEFDYVLSHQTGRRNFIEFSKFEGVDLDNMIKTYPLLGNTTTATFALGWEKLLDDGKVKAGDKIGGIFAGSGIATCQFGLYF